ncbi:MAG: ParB/RepB/Spo0J family partition protein [Clostridia bacterium]|nr:ParB/RepB/Spo0J family partition protein [Clostridia bacterium]
MARRQSGLGRDFFDVLDDNMTESKSESVTTLRISSIEPRKNQPRKTFEEESLKQLADSIASHGVLQPIIVKESRDMQGYYEIIAGERRWRASKMAGLTEIPVVIFDGDDLKAAQVAIIENVQRQDLNPLEEALGYRDLIERFDLTQEQVASQVGKSRPTITNMMRLLELPDEVLEMLKEGKISTGHARALLSLKNPEDIIPLANKIYMRGLSVREIEASVKRLNAESGRSQAKIEEKETKESEQTGIYLRELERKSMSMLGRRVKIHNDPKKKTVELAYIDNGDLEEILRKLCGDDLFDDN